jgi:serine/threonine-protein kinase
MAMNKDFGPFELQKKIGSGGMASVYLAVQKSLQRQVVLKILYPHLAEDEKLVQRFEREARAAAMMRHENIIQVIDCGRQDDVAYICMEFVEGKDLKQWLEAHGTPPIEMALLMLRDLCRGLEHAHGHRIIHRDIKPANIMLTPDGTIKLMDFGLARSGSETSTQMTMVGSVMGTPAYMSPEQATGEVVDERSDIFSTGVVAYELLGGARPFSGDSYSTVLRSILTVDPPDVTHFNPLVPEDVAAIVRKMLAKDVSKRYATISQAREELEGIIEQMGLLRGKDLLKEYVSDPEGVGDRWRKKRLARHLDQGMFYENMGLLKIDDALLEFRRALHLDPDNAVARDHMKKLEREREKVAAMQPAAAAAAAAAPAAKPEKAAPAPKPAAAAKPAPAPKPAAPAGGKKSGLPMPILAAIAAVVVIAVVLGFVLTRPKSDAASDSVAAQSGDSTAALETTPVPSETVATPALSDTAGKAAAALLAAAAKAAALAKAQRADSIAHANAVAALANDAAVTVTASPYATFLVNGESKAQNTKSWSGTLKPGSYTIRVEHPTLGNHEWAVTLGAGDKKELSYDFLAASSGSIAVSTEGGWAEIYLDGDKIGHTTPYVITGVPPGRHEVAVVRDGFNVAGGASTVSVKAGQEVSVTFKLKAKK